MIKYIRQSVKDVDNKALPDFQPGSWVYVEDPSEKELSFLVNTFKLEIGHLQDALDPNEVPRHEEEGNIVYIFTRVPVISGHTFTTAPVLFIIHPDAVLSVTKNSNPVFDVFLENQKNLQTTNRVHLFIRIFNEIIIQYNNAITKINKQASAVTVNVDNIQNRDIVALVIYEQILNEFLNAIIQTNAFLQGLATDKRLFNSVEEKNLIEDIFLATGQIIALLKSSLTQAKNIRDAYSTIMTNNLNRVIKFFTALTIVLTIPMIVTSFFGMNVGLPLSNHPQAFIFIFFGTMIVSVTVLYIFQKRRWL